MEPDNHTQHAHFEDSKIIIFSYAKDVELLTPLHYWIYKLNLLHQVVKIDM